MVTTSTVSIRAWEVEPLRTSRDEGISIRTAQEARMPSLIPPVFHPIVVHLAIGFLVLVPLVATVAAFRRGHWTARALPWLFTLAMLGAAITVGTGLLEEERAEASLGEAMSEELVEPHQLLGIATTLVFGALWAWMMLQRGTLLTQGPSRVLVVALWAALALLVITGWYGGSLVFEHGVGVATQA